MKSLILLVSVFSMNLFATPCSDLKVFKSTFKKATWEMEFEATGFDFNKDSKKDVVIAYKKDLDRVLVVYAACPTGGFKEITRNSNLLNEYVDVMAMETYAASFAKVSKDSFKIVTNRTVHNIGGYNYVYTFKYLPQTTDLSLVSVSSSLNMLEYHCFDSGLDNTNYITEEYNFVSNTYHKNSKGLGYDNCKPFDITTKNDLCVEDTSVLKFSKIIILGDWTKVFSPEKTICEIR